MDTRPARLSGTAVFAGSFICFSFITVFALLSGALGLTGPEFNWGLFIPTLGLVVIAPFFVAGWASVMAAGGTARYLHALTVWAVVTATAGFAIATRLTDFGGEVLKQLGIATGAGVGSHAMIDQLADLKPRLETKFHLQDGKAVTALTFGGKAGSTGKAIRQAAKEDVKETTSGTTSSASERDELASDIKTAARATTWATIAALLVALASTLLGAHQSRYRRPVPTRN